MSYTKLFGSILDSTVWQTPGHVRLVWITMLAMKNADGIVEASVPGLARRAGVTLPECEEALALFLSPDPYSRTPDFEGRRVEVADGGWLVLNHDRYRYKLDMADRREKAAARVAKHRNHKRLADVTLGNAVTRDVTLGNASSHLVRDPDPDTDPDTDPEKKKRHATSGHVQPSLSLEASSDQKHGDPRSHEPSREREDLTELKKKCDALPVEKTNSHKPAIEEFDARYRSAYNAKPTWGSKSAAQIKRLVGTHGVTEVVRRIRILFEHPPAFLTPPHDVGTLVQHFDKLAVESSRSGPLTQSQREPGYKFEDAPPTLPSWQAGGSK